MGKFKMSHGKANEQANFGPKVTHFNNQLEPMVGLWQKEPGLHYATKDEVQKAMYDVLEKHKTTFEALAKHDTAALLKPESFPKNVDNWARKHSIASRIESQKDLNNHKELINKWMQAQSSQLKALDENFDKEQLTSDIIFGNIDSRITILENRKPEEKQIVREITIMKSQIPKSIWIGMGILLILNILTIMIK